MGKRRIGKIDREIYEMTEIGRAYLEYNEAVGGEPFGYCDGMPASIDIDKDYGGLPGMYRECVRRGVTWEELLQWGGHSDEIPD